MVAVNPWKPDELICKRIIAVVIKTLARGTHVHTHHLLYGELHETLCIVTSNEISILGKVSLFCCVNRKI